MKVAIDCGAHVGYFTLLLAHLYGEVHAFEPSKRIYGFLSQNCAPYSHVRTNNAAIGRMDGSITFYQLPIKQSESNTTVRQTLEGIDEQGITEYEVRCVALNSYCNMHDIAPDFIKVDVEGGELALLEGALGLLKHSSPVIALEIRVDKFSQLYRPVLDLMEKQRYKAHKILNDGTLLPCDDVNSQLFATGLDSDNFIFQKR